MGYLEEIEKIKKQLYGGKPFWIPERKVLVVPPNFLIWLGVEDSQICKITTSVYRLARYVLTGISDDNVKIAIATDEDLSYCRRVLDIATNEIEHMEEPYRSRLAELLVLKKLQG
jgi:hypothetical protein